MGLSERFPCLAGRSEDGVTVTMQKVLLSTLITLLERDTAMRAVEIDGRLAVKMSDNTIFYLDVSPA